MKNTWSEKGKVKMALITRRTQIPAYLDRKNNQPVGSFIQPCIAIESARGTMLIQYQVFPNAQLTERLHQINFFSVILQVVKSILFKVS